ncbi:MAG: anthranilate phosphoribosyltransferase [Dehalococcoidia bacterium]|nr:anthranilate phosphoribosyltransferase [Dehalococcoidia bacterium]
MMIRDAIELLVQRQDLSVDAAVQVMEEIMTGDATQAQIGAFLTALRIKGETAEEIAGMARVMRDKAHRVHYPTAVVDTCGTGGDASGSFNVSTAAAFVAAAGGLKVAKHGNRAMSSQCGSADVLEALGVKLELSPDMVRHCLDEAGIGFMFAPAFHPAMRFAAGPRREIGIRTVFNILGPLTNPAGATHQVLGVADASMAPKMASVLRHLGSAHALVVHGEDGLDEMSVCAPTQVWELKDGAIREYRVTPQELGITVATRDAIKGGTAEANAATLRDLLSGRDGALRDMVALNAAAALVSGDRAADLKTGFATALRLMDDGSALGRVDALVRASNSNA